jgi:hypothetical protein
MPRRRVVAGVLIGVGSLVGSMLYRRRAARHRERVDIYADDGSMVSISDGAPETDRLLSLAHELIRGAEG